ncbi:MAG: polysaccharide biosynthesis/export family protein [Bacteroidales bacterium]|nr:polysaccharide biosynthesis/export family protein [Bacteroidales bacterium]
MRKLFLFALALIALASCTPIEKLQYTANVEGTQNRYSNDRSEKTIQPYDYLYIKLYSLDERTTVLFNSDAQYSMMNERMQSYEVDDKGYIHFPFVGKLPVRDLTIDEARQKLETELNKYLSNVSIRLRFVGNTITVVGEVNRPGNYTFYDEKITVFQALGLASDIASWGDKTEVTLLREKDDVISYYYLDLTDKDIVASDFYYLLPNDILIVDPIKQKYRLMQDRSLVYLVLSTLGTTTTAVVSILNYTQNQ